MSSIGSPSTTLEQVLEDLSAAFASVLTRLWILGPGDLCAQCAMRPECPDRSRCLHLVASVGLTGRLDGPFRRFPIGARQVGRVVLDRVPFVAGDRVQAVGLADPLWLSTHRVESFGAFPLLWEERCLGVFAIFSRRRLGEADRRTLSAIGRVLGAALGGAYPSGARPPARDALVTAPGMDDPERPKGDPAGDLPLRPLQQIEREAIERTLHATRGRVSGPHGAARILGLKPTTLHSRMKKLRVRRPGSDATGRDRPS